MLTYFPRIGEIVLCNYPMTALGAEMIKPRPCVIITPRPRRDKLYTVVPLSTTAPDTIEKWHCQLDIKSRTPKSFPDPRPWVKGDVISTVAWERLDRLPDGKRKYMTIVLPAQDIENVRNCVRAALGF